jgi:predicted nucleotidyltransferase component of viral defense system
MNNEIKAMLEGYQTGNTTSSVYALKEIIQEVVLHSLSQTDFFSHAAFYGGTALRIFYGLDRFSEDMDFSLQTKQQDFSLVPYLKAIERGLNSHGFEISAEKIMKHGQSQVQTAFLKGNTLIHLMKILSLEPPVSGVPNNALIKVKLEIDTDPPGGAAFERKYKLLPQPYSVLLYDRPSLFAGKLHALLCRNWRQREKGRDFYDFVWYLREKIPVNISHLEARMRQSGHWQTDEPLTMHSLQSMLSQKFADLDYDTVKKDVIPFVPNPSVLDIWNKEFFQSITKDMLGAI